MDSKKAGFNSVDEYIATFPEDIQAILQELRATIKAAAPDAVEKISYQMPAYTLNGYLIYFAAWKKHIALYPVPGGLPPALEEALLKYERTKGSVHFPLTQPLPLELISEIVKHKVTHNLEKAAAKADKQP